MKIFITGITGTIGTAFVNYLKDEHEIYGVDRNEESIVRFKTNFPDIEVRVGDFDTVDVEADLIIHLAAMKHIDLCEENVGSCIENNIIRSFNLLKQNKDKDILFMSTDKAVEPCSVYGYSKALIEKMVLEQGGAFARSGNILMSSGSVLTIWEEAIKNNQPIKITHKDIHRYFISPENLVKRVWKKYCDGERIIIPKMDKDILLVDLAKELLNKHGLDFNTYPIEYTGLRNGEKLREKLQ